MGNRKKSNRKALINALPCEDDFKSYGLSGHDWLSLWASSDNCEGEVVFFWVEYSIAAEVPIIWYRTFAVGSLPGDWIPLINAASVLKQTGFDEKEFGSGGAQLGAWAKLPAGRYRLQARIKLQQGITDFPGVTFTVNLK